MYKSRISVNSKNCTDYFTERMDSMKALKRTALIILCIGMLGSMTACAGKNRINDATGGTDKKETLDDRLKDGAGDLKDDVEDGARDLKDGLKNGADDLTDDANHVFDPDGADAAGRNK